MLLQTPCRLVESGLRLGCEPAGYTHRRKELWSPSRSAQRRGRRGDSVGGERLPELIDNLEIAPEVEYQKAGDRS